MDIYFQYVWNIHSKYLNDHEWIYNIYGPGEFVKQITHFFLLQYL